jgi:hypothetical protein
MSARTDSIQAILDARLTCTCKIAPTMTDDELMAVRSCAAGWQCSTLDKIRRQFVDYARHDKEAER